jgi:hypothetical protein
MRGIYIHTLGRVYMGVLAVRLAWCFHGGVHTVHCMSGIIAYSSRMTDNGITFCAKMKR